MIAKLLSEGSTQEITTAVELAAVMVGAAGIAGATALGLPNPRMTLVCSSIPMRRACDVLSRMSHLAKFPPATSIEPGGNVRSQSSVCTYMVSLSPAPPVSK